MKKLYIIFVLSIAMAVFSSGCTQNTNSQGSPQGVSPSNTGSGPSGVSRCLSYQDQTSSDAAYCYSTLATETSDYTICENIAGDNDDTKANCYQSVAGKLQDETVCDEMNLPNTDPLVVPVMVGNCKNYVRTIKGSGSQPGTSGATNTLADCQGYENQEMYAATTCYLRLAVKDKDYTICENILGSDNAQVRVQCFNEVAKAAADQTVCDHMTVPYYQYLDMAKQQCKAYAAS